MRIGQARGVHEVRMRHAQALSFGVHQSGKAPSDPAACSAIPEASLPTG